MRIAILAPEFYNSWGGVGIYTHALIQGLARLKNIEVHVICPDIEDSKQKKAITIPKKVTVHTLSTAKDTFVYNFKFQLAIFRHWKKLNKKYQFDLVHSMNLVHMPDIFLKFKKESIPHVVTIHTTINGQISGFLRSNKNPLKMAWSERLSLLCYPYIKLMELWYLHRSKNAITVSNTFKKTLGFKGTIEAIPNCIDIKRLDPKAISLKQAKKHFPKVALSKNPVILFAGRIITQKGIDLFIDVLTELKEEGKKFDVLIAGRGDEDRVRRKLQEKKLAAQLLGFIPNNKLQYFYTLGDIFVLPSFYENFPISLLEAMAMGCASIATRVGAVHEIIENNHNGLLIDAGDKNALKKSITQLLENKKLRSEFAKQGSLDIRSKYSIDQLAKKTMKFYQGVLQ